MKDLDKPAKSKVFRAGNSQAVRIPKALELPEGDVYIERRDGGLFISPLRGRWDLFFSERGVEFPFGIEDLRDNQPARAIDLGVTPEPSTVSSKHKKRSG